jgi:hypothetical protein
MNKILVLLILMSVYTGGLYSQSVTAGQFETGAGLGFGLYHASGNDTAGGASIAASGVLTGHIQYAPVDDLSMGLVFYRNGFLTEKDSGNSIQSYLAGVKVVFRAVNGEKTLLYFGLSGGPSWMHYDHRKNSNYVNGEGYWFDFVAGTSVYFSKRAGMFVELSYNKQHFTHFDDINHNLLMVGPLTNQREFALDLGGMNMRMGLNFKLGGK